MAEIIWLEPAVDDLETIVRYISRDSIRYAQRVEERSYAAVGQLARLPQSGRALDLASHQHRRELIVSPYRVMYEWDEPHERVMVLTVIHGRQHMPSLEDR